MANTRLGGEPSFWGTRLIYVYVLVPVLGFSVTPALMPMSKIRGQVWAVTTFTQVAMVMSVSPRNIAGGIVT